MKFFLTIVFLSLFFVGCADKSADVKPQVISDMTQADEGGDEFEDEFSSDEGSDPLEGYNRVMTSFNAATWKYVMFPVAKGYRAAVPEGARVSVSNFFENLMFPIRFVNNLLQGKVADAFSEGGRFLINTTVGFLGFANVATDVYAIEEHDEDFGQTLGAWGVPPIAHVVLPIFGPSNIRDLGGSVVDGFLNPIDYLRWDYSLGATGVRGFNSFAQGAPAIETMTKDALDMYPLMKNMYEQRRSALVAE